MRNRQRNPVEEVAELIYLMSETELVETLRLVAGRAEERLPKRRWIDLAAHTVADHAGPHVRAQSVRSFLMVTSEWWPLVERLAGEPRRVVALDQLA